MVASGPTVHTQNQHVHALALFIQVKGCRVPGQRQSGSTGDRRHTAGFHLTVEISTVSSEKRHCS